MIMRQVIFARNFQIFLKQYNKYLFLSFIYSRNIDKYYILFILQLIMKDSKINQHFSVLKKQMSNSQDLPLQKKIAENQSSCYKNISNQQKNNQLTNQLNQNTQIRLKYDPKISNIMDQCETIPFPIKRKKIDYDKDKQTIKGQTSNKIIQQINPQKIEVSKAKNSKINQILNKQSLRNRFTSLLPDYLSFPIGYKNQKLIQKMVYIDRTIIFYIDNRNGKTCFFEDVKKTISESMRCTIVLDDLKQIIFLNPCFYKLTWQKHQQLKKYDLIIRIPNMKSKTQDERKYQLRKNLFQYLDKTHQQFLIVNKLQQPAGVNKWHPDFNLQVIKIPLGQLPPHPCEKKIELKEMSKKQIDSISNKQIKAVICKQIQNENKQITTRNVAALILNKKSQTQFSNKLYEMIKKKQLKLAEAKKDIKIQNNSDKIDKEFMMKACEQIMGLYVSKGFNNIFLVNVVEALYKRLNQDYSIEQIKDAIEKLLELQIKFLSESKLPNKGVILKIDKEKYKEVISYYNSL